MTELRKLARHRLLRATLLQRLNRTAILKKKGDNLIWEKEVRKKNWAANLQAEHDNLMGQLSNPMPRRPIDPSVRHHQTRIKSLLEEANMWVDPQKGLPQY